MEYDYEKLRFDLIDYYAKTLKKSPCTLAYIQDIEELPNYMLLKVALNNNMDLSNYIINTKIKK